MFHLAAEYTDLSVSRHEWEAGKWVGQQVLGIRVKNGPERAVQSSKISNFCFRAFTISASHTGTLWENYTPSISGKARSDVPCDTEGRAIVLS